MATIGASHGESGSRRSNGCGDPHEDCGKYTRYTAEQVEVLEKVFAECPKLTLHQQEMIRNHPILSNHEPKQIKAWFQNCRSHEKQKKEAISLQLLNKKLIASNKLLSEEKDRLQKQVSHLVYENEYIRQQLKNCHRLDTMPPQRITHLASNLKACTARSHTDEGSSSSNDSESLLIVAFQFPFESHLQEKVANMARRYILKVISNVQRISLAIKRPGLIPYLGLKVATGSPEAFTLARWICDSYRLRLGADLLRSGCQRDDPVLKQLWYHKDAISCCSFMSLPVCIFANQAALDMLETTLAALQDAPLYQIFDKPSYEELYFSVPKIIQQGFVIIPTGNCVSLMGHSVSYEQAIAWKVFGEGAAPCCLAFAFINLSCLM